MNSPIYDLSFSSPNIEPIRLPIETQANGHHGHSAVSSNCASGSGSRSAIKSVPLIEIDDTDDDIVVLPGPPEMVTSFSTSNAEGQSVWIAHTHNHGCAGS